MRDYVVLRHAGQLRAIPVGLSYLGRCGGTLEFALAEHIGTWVRVHGTEQLQVTSGLLCEHEAGMDMCTTADLESDVPRVSYCPEGSPVTDRDLVIDLARGEAVPQIDREDPGSDLARVTATLTPAGLGLAGLDCDGVVPFATPAP